MRTSWLHVFSCLMCLSGLTSSVALTSSAEAQEASPVCLPFSASEPNASLCSPQCPCSVGQGGCDSDSDCLSGYCSPLAGARFGLPGDFGVCTAARCAPISPAAPDEAACTPECPCPEGWGDCDNDVDCRPGLFCGENYGYLADLPASYGICVSTCPQYDPKLPSASFCNSECPCSQGQGGCKSDDQCQPGLICGSAPSKQLVSQKLPPARVCTGAAKLTVQVSSTLGAQGTVSMPDASTCTEGPCSYKAKVNEEVELIATPVRLSAVSWSGCTRVHGTACYVTMSSDVSVTATFRLVPRERFPVKPGLSAAKTP